MSSYRREDLMDRKLAVCCVLQCPPFGCQNAKEIKKAISLTRFVIFLKFCFSIFVFLYFPNRSLLLRVLILVKRGGYTETHTKREAVSAASRPGVAGAVSFSLGFFHQSQFFVLVFGWAKNCNGKIKGFGTFSLFSLHFHLGAL